MTKPPDHPVPHHRVADGFADHKSDARTGATVGDVRPGRGRRQIWVSDGVHDQSPSTSLGTPSHDRSEFVAPPEPGGRR